MISQIDEFYVAAQIRMLRAADKRTILVLEGETDEKALGRFVDEAVCDIEIAFGKSNLLGAFDLLEEEGFPGIVGIVDADFDRILGRQTSLENICLTDCHDLDLTIFSTAALDKYLAEYADEEAMKSFGEPSLADFRSYLLNAVAPLSYCRLVSERDGHRLYFKDLKHENFVDVDDLVVDSEGLCCEIVNRSNTRCASNQLRRLIAIEATRIYDPMQLARGHDVAAFLGFALRKKIANRRVQQTWASEIEAGLRLAFEWAHFTTTRLCGCLRSWETNNKPYRIFAASIGIN
jgi:hypothetical protein